MERRLTAGAWILGALAAACVIGWAATCHPSAGIGIDDANITFVYARNIAKGAGFVYNAGGERVEGATSFLWTLMVAVLMEFGGGETAVAALCIVLFAVTQVVAARILLAPCDPAPLGPAQGAAKASAPPTEDVRDADDDGSPGAAWGRAPATALLLYFGLVLSCPGYIVWTTLTLMDVTLWGAAVAAAAWYVVHPPRTVPQSAAAAAVWGLMGLVRPEALVVAPVFALLAAWNVAGEDRNRALRTAALLTTSAGAVLGGLLLFREVYFGYPLPNTFYAKVSASPQHNLIEGAFYVGGWLRSTPIAGGGMLLAAVLVLDALFRDAVRFFGGKGAFLAPLDRAERGAAALAAAPLLLTALPLATGGDHFYEYRFLQPAYPLLCVLIVGWLRRRGILEGASDRLARLHPLAPAAAFAGLLLALPLAHRTTWLVYETEHPLEHEFKIAHEGRSRGELYNRLFASQKPLPSVGVVTAGGVAWTYGGEKIDLMGLNNVRMGHSAADRTVGLKNHGAFDEAVFFQLRPDFIDGGAADSVMSVNPRLQEMLLTGGRFQAEYAYGVLSLAADPETAALVSIRRDYLAKLLKEGRHRFQPARAERR